MARDFICDSGVLISLTAGCLDGILYHFAERNNVRFVIPPSVEYETVTRPLYNNLKKHLFSAIRIKDAIADGIVEVVDAKVEDEGRRIMNSANGLFYIQGKPVRLVQYGESEMLALALALGVDNILVDERTTRILIEAPFQLKAHLESEFGVNVMVNKASLRELSSRVSQLKVLRSSELVMLAYEHGFFKNFTNLQREAVEAALYKMKYCGCSISFDEIREYMEMVR
jgi:predicted nucleic acid-binding protein